MALELTRKQRDAVRDEVVTDLSGVGDLAMVVDRGDLTTALRFRDRFIAGVRLLDDLGWTADDPREVFELTLALDQLEPALEHLQDNATAVLRQHMLDPADCELAEQAAIASDAYDAVIKQIDGKRSKRAIHQAQSEQSGSSLAE